MTDHGRKPIRWANDLNTLLAAVAAATGQPRFPVRVADLALEISRSRFPNSPVIAVEGGSLGDFEGALYPMPTAKAGRSSTTRTSRRAASTLPSLTNSATTSCTARSFRRASSVSEESVTFRDGPELEAEADEFAAYLLMPLDDFRRQLPPDAVPSFDDLSAAAARYGVSLIACILRWLEYTSRRSMLIIARDGFVDGPSRANPPTGLGSSSGRASAAPRNTDQLAHEPHDLADRGRDGVDHPAGFWFNEPCTEIALHSDKYDQSLALLHYPKSDPPVLHRRGT